MLRGSVASCLLVFGFSISLGLLSSSAYAQERDPAAAQALFDQARELTKQGHYADACSKLEESNRLDPGIGTQFYLADCYERSGRVASAWATFLDVASQARAGGQLDRDKLARQRAERLEPRLPRLLIAVPESSKTPGLEIRRNGMLVGAAQWGAAVPVDPGEVELSASAPGKRDLHQTLRLEEGKTASYNLPALSAAELPAVKPPSSAAEPVTPAPAQPASAPAPAPSTKAQLEQPAATSSNAPWIIALTGVGVVGLGVGGTFAILARNQYNDSKAQCLATDPNACNPGGLDLRNKARTKGDIATVGFLVGGAALASAGVVWLVSGSSEEKHRTSASTWRAAPAIGPGVAALFMQGTF